MAEHPNLPPDYHTHTHLCKHAEGEPKEYAQAAQQAGLPALAITDHCPCPFGYDPSHRMDMDQVDEYNAMLEDAASSVNLPLLRGIEADFYQGCFVFQEEFLKEQNYDVVLGSVHYQCFWAKDVQNKTLWDDADILNIWRRYFKLVLLMAESGLYDVAAHIDLPKKFGNTPSDEQIREMVEPTLDQIVMADMAIEINTNGLLHEVNEMYPSKQILSLALDRGIPITFGSDAHEPNRVGANFSEAVALAKEVGFTEYAVFSKREMSFVQL